MPSRRDNSRHIQARTGSGIRARSWLTEAAVRMLQNNLDPRVAEAPAADPGDVEQDVESAAQGIPGELEQE